MAVNINLARQKVEAVRTETEDFANTALRVGGAMSDILEYSYEEAERAKGAEKNIASLVQNNTGKINILIEVSATKAELSEEVERAKSAEEAIRDSVESLSDDMNAASEDISKLENALEVETSRAKAAEQSLSMEITDAENRVDERISEVRDSLEENIIKVGNLLVDERDRAKAAEQALTQSINAIQKSVWGGEEKVVFDAYEVAVIAPLMQTSVVGGGIIVYVRNPNTDNEIANGFFYKLNGSYYRDALIDGVDILLPLRDEQRKLYPEKNYVCNGKTYYVDNNFLSLTMKSSIPVFEESTEEAIEEMIANGTWKEGVIYYTVEE